MHHEILVTDKLIGIGGFADVRRAIWMNSDRDEEEGELAVKIFRKLKFGDRENTLQVLNRRLYGEIQTWSRAQPHANVLPFLGIHYYEQGHLPALVSPYRPAGDVLEYVSQHDYKRRSLALGIANGLAHLHAWDIVHGDLKPVTPLSKTPKHSLPNPLSQKNILIHIDYEGKPIPQIADFGRAKILHVKGFTGSLRTTWRYTAPEVLNSSPTPTTPSTPESPVIAIPSDQENQLLTKQSDVWSLGMVLLHVLSGKEPYPTLSDFQIVIAFLNKEEPKEPDHPNLAECPAKERVWPLLRRCWEISKGPEARCSAKECAAALSVPLKEHTADSSVALTNHMPLPRQ
ncbi:hypothetical protein NP233_g1804 [Leucocoprinus birnbaumii]|uniref:Protein kinase domain-containing protein n=1 Tax=Leucocoprinus birnbaumii TaxID=56174 RepID=A0AAD5YXP5_9AGAR|nr:hypothetical protein NP233_g1804 [Leucocoprinus birnbaumii]